MRLFEEIYENAMDQATRSDDTNKIDILFATSSKTCVLITSISFCTNLLVSPITQIPIIPDINITSVNIKENNFNVILLFFIFLTNLPIFILYFISLYYVKF